MTGKAICITITWSLAGEQDGLDRPVYNYSKGGTAMAETEVQLTDSILETVKLMDDFSLDDDSFDIPIIRYINSYLQILWMQGVGKSGFKVTGTTETWADVLGPDTDRLMMAASYISKKVKLAIDPPQSTALYNAIDEQSKELGYYLRVESNIIDAEEDEDEDN